MSKSLQVEFTKDMAESLNHHFNRFSVGGVVKLLVNEKGVWAHTISGEPVFLGLARAPGPMPPHGVTVN